MCLITEHVKALKELEELKTKIASMESPPPVTELTMISRADYLARMPDIQPIVLLDSFLSITTKAELDRIAPYLVYPANNYITEIWDCDDYGIQAQADATLIFHVSGVRMCLGSMPLGYHGFVITEDTDGNIWWLEPNAGFEYAGVWHKVGELGYRPDKIFA